MLRKAVVAATLVAACGDNAPIRPDAMTEREVLVLRAVANHDLDVLIVLDDTELDKQTYFKQKIGILHDMLATLDPPAYDLHAGVISSDMGTVGSLDPTQPAPGIGSGPGSCAGFGKNGSLQAAGASPPTGAFLAERLDADGTLTKNFTGTFEQTMQGMMSLGAGGCGFEQPLAAMKRSFENPANAGFVRAAANLAVIIFQEEDDCSVRDARFFSTDTSVLGPLQSFRCTRWGLQCNEDIAVVGAKTGCHPWADSPYIDDVARFVEPLLAIKGDPRMVAVTGIIGNPEPIEVELRVPPGGTSPPIPALHHSCDYTGSFGPEVADPGKRLQFFLEAFPPQTSTALTSICDSDLGPALHVVSAAIKKTLGDTCIDTSGLRDADAVTAGVQPACVVEDVRDSDPTPVAIPFELVGDDRMCPDYADHLRLVLHRTDPPTPDAWTHVRCELAP